MKKKKLAIILICAVMAASGIIGGIFMMVESAERTLDITYEVAGYYVISVNPAVEIAVGVNGNVISVSAQNDDGGKIITDTDFSGMTVGEAIESVLVLIREAGYLSSGGKYDEITIGYFSDAEEKSEEEILMLVPQEYRDSCSVKTVTGKAAQRSAVSLKAPPNTQVAATAEPTGTPAVTPDVTVTPEPSPSETPEETTTSLGKKSGSDDGVRHAVFNLSVRISGGNAVFTWTKLDYVDFFYAELRCSPKATSTWKERTPKVIKKITNENTTSCSVSLSSLSMKAGEELFFSLHAYDKDPNVYDSGSGTYASCGTNNTSIKKMADGSYKVNNNNPSIFGYGEAGVDYLPPTLSVSEAGGTLFISWKKPDPTHEDFDGVYLYVSETSTVPNRPESYNGNYLFFNKNQSSYYIDTTDFYSLKKGKTYYFTLYSHFFGGDVVAGNTVRATIPAKKDTAFVNVHLNTLYEHLYIYWTDAEGSNIISYKYNIEYKDANSDDRVFVLYGTNQYGSYNKSSGKFETWRSVDFIPGRTYYVSLYTIYTDGTQKLGNEVAVLIPGEVPTEAPTPVPSPSEEPTAEPSGTPTESPSETPSETACETPAPTPGESPTDMPSAEPTPEPTEAPTEEPTPEPTEAPTEEPTAEPSPTDSVEPTG